MKPYPRVIFRGHAGVGQPKRKQNRTRSGRKTKTSELAVIQV